MGKKDCLDWKGCGWGVGDEMRFNLNIPNSENNQPPLSSGHYVKESFSSGFNTHTDDDEDIFYPKWALELIIFQPNLVFLHMNLNLWLIFTEVVYSYKPSQTGKIIIVVS